MNRKHNKDMTKGTDAIKLERMASVEQLLDNPNALQERMFMAESYIKIVRPKRNSGKTR